MPCANTQKKNMPCIAETIYDQRVKVHGKDEVDRERREVREEWTGSRMCTSPLVSGF